MAEKTLIAKVSKHDDDPEKMVVTSPVVGMADGAPKAGLFLNPFDRIITMKILNQRFLLRMPRDAYGRITEVFIPNAYKPVEYGQPLFVVDPHALDEGSGSAGGAAGAAAAGEAADAGLITVEAPSDGIFYRRPSPDAPPYVEVGAEVSAGSMLGLVEIMKCFHQITYGGLGLPPSGTITKILAEDASEVRFGQALFHVKPAE
jgi:acetyl-CoA carboxylase biotin carboxyl carrier protein